MKSITIVFEDKDFEDLTAKKDELGLGWRDLILTLTKRKE